MNIIIVMALTKTLKKYTLVALVSEDHADDQVLQSLPFQDSIPLLRINNISLIISSNLTTIV